MKSAEAEKRDTTLATRVQKGDREAFGEIVERFQARIFSFTYQFFREREAAAEATQETFLRAYRYINRYDPKKKFSPWIYSIARNICIDEKRRMVRHKTVSLNGIDTARMQLEPSGQHHKDPSRISQHLEDRILLEKAVKELPEKYQIAIVLRYFQELTYQEIADILGLSLDLVKVRIFRAKSRLLEILNVKQGGTGG